MKKIDQSSGGSPSPLWAILRVVSIILLVLAACGIYDVSRNKKIDSGLVKKYFMGNGILTWLLSPLNTLMDVLALPYVNKGVYKLGDLPEDYQEEIQRLIDAAYSENLVAKLEEKAKESARTMIFFKWYGTNQETSIDIPAYHEKYKYIQTIGVSVFNKKQSTSKHFGPLRPSLRVLYNINDLTTDQAYIEVGDVKHIWRDDKLFIFDDTLMHQSFNESDQVRYCLFVDILRPSKAPALFATIAGLVQFFLRGVNFIFYKNWNVIK